jgi:hypothetical protein
LDVFLIRGGLRDRQVNSWYWELWWDKANIVATDFFLSNSIVTAAINSNNRRKLCRNRSSLNT